MGKQVGVVCPPSVTVPQISACTDFFEFIDSTDLREIFINIQSINQVNAWGAGATVTWPLSGFAIVSQTSCEANDRRFVNDSDAGPFSAVKTNVVSDFYQFIQKVRGVSAIEGPLLWLVGGNYYVDVSAVFKILRSTFLVPAAS